MAGLSELISAALPVLTSLCRGDSTRLEAEQRLARLEADAPAARFVLGASGDEFELLVHAGSEGTVALAMAGRGRRPWILRAARPWSDQELLRVNGVALKVADALACIDHVWTQSGVMRRLIDLCLVREAIVERGLRADGDEVQQALTRFRRRLGLHEAAAMHRWMSERGLTPGLLYERMADDARLDKLIEEVAGRDVERYFADHREELACVRVVALEFANEADAVQARAQMRTERDFHAVAEERFARTGMAPRYSSVRAGDEALRRAEPGAVLGPQRHAHGFELCRVVTRSPPQLDQDTRLEIRALLFESWLAERRKAARIEWHWGSTQQRSEAASPPRGAMEP
jgi:putative peptide maturation system protein